MGWRFTIIDPSSWDFMHAIELFDLGFHGPTFTWRGCRNGELVEEHLDRGLINGLWQNVWPNTTALHGITLGSDHCPVIITSNLDGPKGRKLFWFEASWAKEEDGAALMQWIKKLDDCRCCLLRWSRNKFKKKGQQIVELLEQLGELQKNWRLNLDEIKANTRLIDDLWAQEESFWQ